MLTKDNILIASANLTNMSNFITMSFWDVYKSKFDHAKSWGGRCIVCLPFSSRSLVGCQSKPCCRGRPCHRSRPHRSWPHWSRPRRSRPCRSRPRRSRPRRSIKVWQTWKLKSVENLKSTQLKKTYSSKMHSKLLLHAQGPRKWLFVFWPLNLKYSLILKCYLILIILLLRI